MEFKIFRDPVRSKPQHMRRVAQPHENNDYMTGSQWTKDEVEGIELKECDENIEDTNKDYYFMDTTQLGKYPVQHTSSG